MKRFTPPPSVPIQISSEPGSWKKLSIAFSLSPLVYPSGTSEYERTMEWRILISPPLTLPAHVSSCPSRWNRHCIELMGKEFLSPGKCFNIVTESVWGWIMLIPPPSVPAHIFPLCSLRQRITLWAQLPIFCIIGSMNVSLSIKTGYTSIIRGSPYIFIVINQHMSYFSFIG